MLLASLLVLVIVIKVTYVTLKINSATWWLCTILCTDASTLQVQQEAEINNCTSRYTELQHSMGSLVPAMYMVLELRNPFPQSLYVLIFQVQNIKWTLLNNTITKQLYWSFKNLLCKIVLQKLVLKPNKVNTNYYPISVILLLKKIYAKIKVTELCWYFSISC